MVLSGIEIKARRIIFPFHGRTEVQHANGKIFTFGVGPAGYDVRAEFGHDIKHLVLHPGDFALAATVEHFTMPHNVLGVVHDKSSWARQGVLVQNTVIEPGWRGFLTLELTNNSKKSILLTPEIPIAQIVFHLVQGEVDTYKGKYQDQHRFPQEAI